MIADSPYRDRFPSAGADRRIASFDELSDDDFLRRIAISLRKQARNTEANRLDTIADRIAALRQSDGHHQGDLTMSVPMHIALTLEVDEDHDVDASDDTGITNDAYERLAMALQGAGFSIVDGPDRKAH